jgi:hypothetical protein
MVGGSEADRSRSALYLIFVDDLLYYSNARLGLRSIH